MSTDICLDDDSLAPDKVSRSVSPPQIAASCDAMNPTTTSPRSLSPLLSNGLSTSASTSTKMPNIWVADEGEILRSPCFDNGIIKVAENIDQYSKEEKGIKLGLLEVYYIMIYSDIWLQEHPAVSPLFTDKNSNRPCATAYRKIHASKFKLNPVPNKAALSKTVAFTVEETKAALSKTVAFTIEETKLLHTICKDVHQFIENCELVLFPTASSKRSLQSTTAMVQNPLPQASHRTYFFCLLEKIFPNPESYNSLSLGEVFMGSPQSFKEDPQVLDKEHPQYGNPKLQLSQANLSRILEEVERVITGGPGNESFAMDNRDLGVMQLLCKLITNSSEILAREYLTQYLLQLKREDFPDHYAHLVYDIQNEPSYFVSLAGGTVWNAKLKWSIYLILITSKNSKIWSQLPHTLTLEEQYSLFQKSQELQSEFLELENRLKELQSNLARTVNRNSEKDRADVAKMNLFIQRMNQIDVENAAKIKDLARAKEKLENDLARSTSDLLQSREIQNRREEKHKSELEAQENELKDTKSKLEKSTKQIEKIKSAATKKFEELKMDSERKDGLLRDVKLELDILKLDFEEVSKGRDSEKENAEAKEKELLSQLEALRTDCGVKEEQMEGLRKERDDLRLELSAKVDVHHSVEIHNHQEEEHENELSNITPDIPSTNKTELSKRTERRKKLAQSKASGLKEQSTTNQLLEKNVELMNENKDLLKEREELRVEVDVLRKKMMAIKELSSLPVI